LPVVQELLRRREINTEYGMVEERRLVDAKFEI
jgi:hypothetical protein